MKTRITLRDLKSQAANVLAKSNAALNQGQLTIEEINKIVVLVAGLVNTTNDFVEDLADGIEFEICVKPTGIEFIDKIVEGWGGKIPFTVRMDPREN
jgi:enamine deaminase RidA (YjgF/YER057c/UK114 family)